MWALWLRQEAYLAATKTIANATSPIKKIDATFKKMSQVGYKYSLEHVQEQAWGEA